jgi:hypothetical protein
LELADDGINEAKTCSSNRNAFVYVKSTLIGVMNEIFNSIKTHGINNVTILCITSKRSRVRTPCSKDHRT